MSDEAELESLQLELLVADRDHVERRLEKVREDAKSGDPKLKAEADELERVLAHLDAEQPLGDVSMRAVVRRPNGSTETFELHGSGAERSAVWLASEPGLHGIDIVATARAQGQRIERSAFLAVDVQP